MPANRFVDVCYPCQKKKEEREAHEAWGQYSDFIDGEGLNIDNMYVQFQAIRKMLNLDERMYWRTCLRIARQLQAEQLGRFDDALQRRGESE